MTTVCRNGRNTQERLGARDRQSGAEDIMERAYLYVENADRYFREQQGASLEQMIALYSKAEVK